MLNNMINKIREVRDAFRIAFVPSFILGSLYNVVCTFEVMNVFLFPTQTLLSLPDVVKNCDQLQQLVEYIG